MKHLQISRSFNLLGSIVALLFVANVHAQETTNDTIEYDDSENEVHGVYLGINLSYGTIDGKATYLGGAKIAYVANQQFEIGFAGMGLYSDQNENGLFDENDLVGGYGGLHLEPIIFGKSKFSLTVPMLIGGGVIGRVDKEYNLIGNDNIDSGTEGFNDWASIFVFEPGLSFQYNVSSFLQVELGAKYRFSSDITLSPETVKNINGFSAGIGVKVGVFNLGRKNKN